MCMTFRYEEALRQTWWSSVRKGAAFGLFMGWSSLVTYIVYPVVFFFGWIYMSSDDQNRLRFTDLLVVSD